MSSRRNRPRNQSISQQHSNSVANLPTELGQQSTRDAPVENGNQTDSDNGEVASALVASNGIFHQMLPLPHMCIKILPLSHIYISTVAEYF